MKIVIIHGDKATGKTRNAETFNRLYRCRRIIDDWFPGQKLRDGDLALTNIEPPFNLDNVHVVSIERALKDARAVFGKGSVK